MKLNEIHLHFETYKISLQWHLIVELNNYLENKLESRKGIFLTVTVCTQIC